MEEKQVDKPTEEKKAESANTFTFNFSNLPQSAQSTTLPTDVENATPEQLKQVIKEKLEKEVKEKLASLPPLVQRRVIALQKLQDNYKALNLQYKTELQALEDRYRALKAPFHQKRHDIVIGTYEPIDADLPEKAVTVAIATSVPTVVPIAVPIAVTTAVTAPPEVVVPTIPDTSKGIPDFWLQVFRNCSFVSEMITENDEPAIKHLVDIRTTQEDLKGFTLEFEFSDNEFFTDKILVKKYITSDNEYSDDSTFEKAEGTKINWKPGKDLTHRTIQKKSKSW